MDLLVPYIVEGRSELRYPSRVNCKTHSVFGLQNTLLTERIKHLTDLLWDSGCAWLRVAWTYSHTSFMCYTLFSSLSLSLSLSFDLCINGVLCILSLLYGQDITHSFSPVEWLCGFNCEDSWRKSMWMLMILSLLILRILCVCVYICKYVYIYARALMILVILPFVCFSLSLSLSELVLRNQSVFSSDRLSCALKTCLRLNILIH